MLKYLVRFARDPVKARRAGAIRLCIGLIIAVAGPAVLNLWVHPRSALRFDFSESLVVIIACFALLAVFYSPMLAIYSRPRRQRERYLGRGRAPGAVIQSVYLTPNLIRFIERETTTSLSPYAESVTLVITTSAIEFWSGGAKPIRSAAIKFAAIESLLFLQDEERFARPEIKTAITTIPLYATAGWLGVSRKSSQRLQDRLVNGLGGMKRALASGD